MKSTWSKVARGAFAALVVAAIATLACTCRNGVETDLYALLDSTRQSVLRALADNVGGQLRILLEGPDQASLDAPAAEFKAYMGSHVRTEVGSITNTLAALAPRSGGLLSEETRALLLAGEYGTVATNAATALISGLLAPLVSVKEDPYLLATDYLTHFQARDNHGWSIRDGDPVREQDGRCYRLLVFDGFKTSDSSFICDVIERVRTWGAAVPAAQDRDKRASPASVAQERDPPVKAYVSGAPFHAALATERSKREINILSAVSLVVVLALGVWLFRSVRFVVPLVATLASAFLVATSMVFAVWGRPHVLTFVFGTTLIGLGVDYVYHACAAEDVRTVRRPLAYALVTTLACFAPLFFSSVAVLRQMALFTGTGLLTTWAAVMAWFGRAGARPSHWDNGHLARCEDWDNGRLARCTPGGRSKLRPSHAILTAAVILLGICAGAFRIRLSSDPAQFYRPDPFLAEGEGKFYELNQAAAARFAVVEGATVQEALEREEAVGVKGLSAIIPSLKRQRENQALAVELRKRTGSAYSALTGVPVRDGEDARGLLDPEAITDPLLKKLIRPMCVKANGRVLLVSPLPPAGGPRSCAADGASAAGLTIVEPRRELMSLFDAYAREAYRLLGISFVLLTALLAALFRRRFLACALPVALAALATLGVLGWCGVQLTFFHALCFFVCTGLGLDYVVFHLEVAASAILPNRSRRSAPLPNQSRGSAPLPNTRRVVFVSFLTSAVAFGLLALTSFPVTRAMGAVLALGLFFVYLFSSCIGRGVCGKLSATHEEKR